MNEEYSSDQSKNTTDKEDSEPKSVNDNVVEEEQFTKFDDENENIESEKIDKKDYDNLYKKWLLAIAEQENIKKSYLQMMNSRVKTEVKSLLKDMLGILDQVMLARQAAKSDPSIETGLKMTCDEINKILNGKGVSCLDIKVGDKFDSKKHFAVFEEYSDDIEVSCVMQIYSQGYLINEELLRPGNVVISKGSKDQDEST